MGRLAAFAAARALFIGNKAFCGEHSKLPEINNLLVNGLAHDFLQLRPLSRGCASVQECRPTGQWWEARLAEPPTTTGH